MTFVQSIEVDKFDQENSTKRGIFAFGRTVTLQTCIDHENVRYMTRVPAEFA